ncbi:MAG: tRNA uridine-5-carboxymethylaminomethyl(34) synthesis GTPase MnmE [Chloroflexi bacterium]|nr:tRNA uridine-5-carboxymethylaminomethyl(34) synthesis GTPase MnmE [Chloroflexota bacterium]
MAPWSLDDTIAAIATPPGLGGIGIVRLSGPEALSIARRLFVPADRAAALTSHTLTYGHIVDPVSGRPVDEVLLVYLAAPRTYTRQEVVEIDTHGGPVPTRAILALCLASGARAATEGEFTLRAFLNGRLDLAQAEAVLDVVSARTDGALGVAVAQLDGVLSQRVRAVRRTLLDALAWVEANVDFEQDVPPRDLGAALADAAAALNELLRQADQGAVYREGVRTAIVGRPNVGKSSLLNALLRADRAIVTPIPGTTRDTLEETCSLQGIPLVLIDTAGISETDDLVERLGIERSRRAVAQADLVLLVGDGSAPPTKADVRVAALCGDRRTVVVVNKGDQPLAGGWQSVLPDAPHQVISALTGEGLRDLEALLVEVILGSGAGGAEPPAASNPRHRAAFGRALVSVGEAQRALREQRPMDMLSIDLTEAVTVLGEVTGETASDALLETIFGQFCIGK